VPLADTTGKVAAQPASAEIIAIAAARASQQAAFQGSQGSDEVMPASLYGGDAASVAVHDCQARKKGTGSIFRPAETSSQADSSFAPTRAMSTAYSATWPDAHAAARAAMADV
jgi:hypothetical protein